VFTSRRGCITIMYLKMLKKIAVVYLKHIKLKSLKRISLFIEDDETFSHQNDYTGCSNSNDISKLRQWLLLHHWHQTLLLSPQMLKKLQKSFSNFGAEGSVWKNFHSITPANERSLLRKKRLLRNKRRLLRRILHPSSWAWPANVGKYLYSDVFHITVAK